MTALLLISLSCTAIAAGWAAVACYCAWMLRDRCRRLRAQIAEERIAAADEQSRMIAVATAECGHDVAWKMLEAVAAPVRHRLAREILEDVSP